MHAFWYAERTIIEGSRYATRSNIVWVFWGPATILKIISEVVSDEIGEIPKEVADLHVDSMAIRITE